MKSFYRLLAGIVSIALLAGMIPGGVWAEDTAVYTFFHDKKTENNCWANTYVDEQGRGGYISEIEDSGVAKEGSGSYRIKLDTPYYVNTDMENVAMLYTNLVSSPVAYTPDTASQYLTFWYQPLLKREKVEVGFACGSGVPFGMLRVNLMDYISVADSEYGDSASWKEVRIPMADFLDDSKAVFYENGTGLNGFNWDKFAGFSIAGSDENLGTQVNFCRVDEVKVVDSGTVDGEPEEPEETQYPQGEAEKTFFTDASTGWIDTAGNEYLSVIDNDSAAKVGAKSMRLKLSTPAGYESNGTMLYANLIGSPGSYTPDMEDSYFCLWYQPLLKRERVEVGFVCGSERPFGMLRVNLLDYVTISNGEYGDNAPWKLVKIPMADFFDHAKATYYDNGTGLEEFNWEKFTGFSIAGSDENLGAQVNFCRVDEVKIVNTGTGGGEPEETRKPEISEYPEGKAEQTFFTDTKTGWVDTAGNEYLSVIDNDSSAAKVGTISMRLKLSAPAGYQSNGTMLYANLIGSPGSYTPDREDSYLCLWYQPLLKRERVEVGFACGSERPFGMLRVNLLDYVTINNEEYGDNASWKLVKIPMADFFDHAKATYYDNGTGLEEFNWEKFTGFSIAGSDENLGAQVNFCRVDEVKIMNVDSGEEKPTTRPTTKPTTKPTTAPTGSPTTKPTTAPTAAPTREPIEPGKMPEAKGEADYSFFDDNKIGWSVTYTDSQDRGSYISEIIDTTAMKEGKASYRLKLLTPYYINSDTSNVEMLFCNIVNNPSTYSPDKKNTYLEFWYQPLLKREKIEVGFACGGGKPYATLRVNLMDYISVADSEYGDSAAWQLVKIPMSDFKDKGKTFFDRNGSSYSEFDWTRFAGFSIAGSDENLTEQTNFCRLDDIKISKYIGAPVSAAVTGKSYDTVTLQWQSPGESVDGYYIYRDGVYIGSTPNMNFTDTGLQGNKTYTYWIQAYKGKAESEAAVVSVQTDGYFSQKPGTGVFFENIRYFAGNAELSDYVLQTGSIRFEASIGIEEITAPVYAVAALYDQNKMKECKIQEITTGNAGSTVAFNGQFSVGSTEEFVDVFLIDSLENLRAMTGCYRISGQAYRILDGVKAPAVLSGANAEYSPRTGLIRLSMSVSAGGTAAVLVVPADVDFTALRPTDILWLGCVAAEAQGESFELAFPKEKFPEGEYVVLVGAGKNSFRTEPFYYAADATIEALLAVLKNQNSSKEQVLQALTNRALALDLTDFNTFSQAEKLTVCGLFQQYYEGDGSQIEEAFAKAQGVARLGMTTKNGCEMILKYGKYLTIDEQFTKGIETGYSAKVKKNIDALMTDSAVVYETASDPEKNAVSRVETVCILGLLNDPDLTWGGMKTYLTKTFVAYDIADTDAIDRAGVSESSVYKEMIGKTYKSFQAVDDALKKAIEKATKKPPSNNSSGGGGGGSFNPGISKPEGLVVQPDAKVPQEELEAEKPVYFKDAAGMTWAYEFICGLAEKNVIAYAETFRPNDDTTRAEFVKMVVQAFGLLDTEAQCGFADVPTDSWEYPYVASAVNAGIIQGMEDSYFGSNQPVTRQDMACILYRVLDFKAEAGREFLDQDQISAYAVEAVAAMSSLGILNGYEDGCFKPGQFATRAEVAVMLSRGMKMEKA